MARTVRTVGLLEHILNTLVENDGMVEPMPEDLVYEQHAQAAKDLQYALSVWQEQKREAQEQMRELEKRMNYVRSAVAQGQWWLLEGTLEPEQIELLCQVEPGDRLSLLDEPWE